MPDTTATRQVIAVDPDGVPVALRDIAGDTIDGTLWGAARAGGAFALVVTEHDHFSHEPVAPTAGMMRALADALDDDPNDPHLTEGSRLWWREEATRRKAAADQLAADVERCQQSIREYAAEADVARGRAETAERELAEAHARAQAAEDALADARARLARVDPELRSGAINLIRAAVRHEEATHHRRELAQLHREYRGKGMAAAGVALLLGWALGRAR